MESLRNSVDFKEMLSCLNAENVRFLVVGGFALSFYGRPRYTKDIDIWLDATEQNAQRVHRALTRFGAPLAGIDESDFSKPDMVLQFGNEPIRIDFLTSLDGIDFGSAWQRRVQSSYAEVPVFVIGRDDYVANKRAVGRPRDLRDVEALLEVQDER
jgi:Nucleotidyl transferase of unknown function (DUF2204)